MVQDKIMLYCEKVNNLPTVPNYLIKDLDTIETYTDLFLKQTDEYVGIYSSYKANLGLEDFIQQFFEYPVLVRYQVIKKSLPIHIDKAKVSKKLNYIIDTGGNVKTRWWSSVNEPRQILSEYQQEVNTWYNLDIHTPHDITIPDRPRISITVREAS